MSAVSKSKKLVIESVQAIDYIALEFPENTGGVKLFTGHNGAGKTTALRCLQALLGQKIDLEPSDGEPKGHIEGLGVKRTISGRSRTTGEPNVSCLEGRFDFSDLVEPTAKDPAVRNKSRIRALVGLCAKPSSQDDFAELFASRDEMENVVGHLESSDVLELADKIAKATQQQARDLDQELSEAEIGWRHAVEQAAGHDASKEPETVDQLADAYSLARDKREAAERHNQRMVDAVASNSRITKLIADQESKAPSITLEKALDGFRTARKQVEELELALAEAQLERDRMQELVQSCTRYQEDMENLRDSLQEVQESIELAPLVAAEQSAKDRLTQAEQIRQKHEAAKTATRLKERVKALRESSARMREIGKRTNEIVTRKIPEGELHVVDGELSVYHERRQTVVPYDQLSDGERWRLALSVAIPVVGEGGIVPVRQEAWQALQPKVKQEVAEVCREAKVWLVSAEVADGPLSVTEL